MICKWCSSTCKKDGKQKNGTQKLRCKNCKRYQQGNYVYNAYKPVVHDQFIKFRKFGISHRYMTEFLEISFNTLQKWILKANNLIPRYLTSTNDIYDVDELKTYFGNKANETWVAYGWNVRTKTPVGLNIGNRTAKDLKKVVESVLVMSPKWINTDGWASYPSIIPKKFHRKGRRKSNHIERNHVNLRKDIGYLGRRTICFAKTREMIEARIRWYFWGTSDPYFFLRKQMI